MENKKTLCYPGSLQNWCPDSAQLIGFGLLAQLGSIPNAQNFSSMKDRLTLAVSSVWLVFVLFTNPDRYRAWFRTNIKAKATAGATGSAIGDRIIALAVQSFALS
jgi:hypothetical protein